ncbi:MAG TPA: hypothetical protein PLA50_00365 [Bacteroidia bacterium]|nr:hypothetical protein [Bacteroidia bacterium]
MKTRNDNILARLKGREWGGMPAQEYLLMRLDGEDGEPAWTLEVAAKAVAKKLKAAVSIQTLSRWRKRMKEERRHSENFEAMIEATVSHLAKQSARGVSIDDMVDAQITMMIGRVYAEDGVAEAIKFMGACTALKRALTADREQKQGVREYEESVQALKHRIEVLTMELKARGYDPAALDELNRRTVAEIDAVILGNKGLAR